MIATKITAKRYNFQCQGIFLFIFIDYLNFQGVIVDFCYILDLLIFNAIYRNKKM